MNNQYELEIEEKDIRDYYVDQASFGLSVPGLHYFGSYTPQGIRILDEEYSNLIKNLNIEVKEVFAINRCREICVNSKTGETFEGKYKTYYDPIPIDEKRGAETRVVWENNVTFDFLQGEKPVFDSKTRKTNPEHLRQSIKKNPHLHTVIKENLLQNLESILALKF